MKPLYVINDTHCGAIRSGGTTPRTAFALREYILELFQNLLKQAEDGDLMILGDLFDTFNVPYTDLFAVYDMLLSWLEETGNRLILVAGNHDLSKTSATMSSFQFLCRLLKHRAGVIIVDGGPGLITMDGFSSYVIPHMANQELFDIELAKVPKVDYLFLHCNYDNKFAQQSDHSLNLSLEHARKLSVGKIVIAHEHQRKMALSGKVMIPGNQIPSSVADCLGNEQKFMVKITAEKFELVPVWEAKGSFQRVDWHELQTVDPAAQFVRVEGEASASEAPAVVSLISKLRGQHKGFVITNAVKIEGRVDEETSLSLEQIQSYNVLEALLKRLKPEWQTKVRQLMEDNSVNA